MSATQAAQRERQHRRDDGGAATEHHPGGHQCEGAGGGDEHRLEHLAELHDAEVELHLEDRQADDDAAERQVLDELDAGAVLRLVLTDGAAALVLEEQRGTAWRSRRRRSASGGWGPTA